MVERFRAALQAAGITVPEGGHGGAVEAIDQLIAPRRLPEGLRRLWSALPVGSLPLGPATDLVAGDRPFEQFLCDPALSYQAYRSPGRMPDDLILLARHGDSYRLAVLADPGGEEDGAVFGWSARDDALKPVAPSIATWLGTLTTALAEGACSSLSPSAETSWIELEMGRVRTLERESLTGSSLAPRALGPSAGPVDMSISRFLHDKPARATVAGLARREMWGGPGIRLQVFDGTGVLDAWCSTLLETAWLLEGRDHLELDIAPDPSEWPVEPRVGVRNELERAMLATQPHALVSAVRPRLFG